ncbi:MAG: hypothetical protein ACKO8G_01435 [Actinomycetota bacterium]
MTRAAVGILLIVAAALVMLVAITAGRQRLRTLPLTLALAASGAAVATGGLMVQEGVTLGDRVLAIAVLAAITPLHLRVAFGPRPAGE